MLVTGNIDVLTERPRKAGARFIMPEVVAISQDAQAQLGFKRAIMGATQPDTRYDWSSNSERRRPETFHSRADHEPRRAMPEAESKAALYQIIPWRRLTGR